MSQTNVGRYFNGIEKFSLLFSGLVHDIGHPGYTNQFEINSYSKLALRYHDESVFVTIFMLLGSRAVPCSTYFQDYEEDWVKCMEEHGC